MDETSHGNRIDAPKRTDETNMMQLLKGGDTSENLQRCPQELARFTCNKNRRYSWGLIGQPGTKE
jgi:hypothetical protein